MSTAYKFGDQALPHFVTFATCYWIDVFIRPEYVQILTESIY